MKHKSRFLLPILTFLTFGMVTGSIVAADYINSNIKEASAYSLTSGKVYYVDNHGWNNIYVHAFHGSTAEHPWGSDVKMTDTGYKFRDKKIYEYTLEDSATTHVIFKNNPGDTSWKTGDIALESGDICLFDPYYDVGYKGTWRAYKGGINPDLHEKEVIARIPTSWTSWGIKKYCYSYYNDDWKNNAWPGYEMDYIGQYGSYYYYHTYTKLSYINVIINDNDGDEIKFEDVGCNYYEDNILYDCETSTIKKFKIEYATTGETDSANWQTLGSERNDTYVRKYFTNGAVTQTFGEKIYMRFNIDNGTSKQVLPVASIGTAGDKGANNVANDASGRPTFKYSGVTGYIDFYWSKADHNFYVHAKGIDNDRYDVIRIRNNVKAFYETTYDGSYDYGGYYGRWYVRLDDMQVGDTIHIFNSIVAVGTYNEYAATYVNSNDCFDADGVCQLTTKYMIYIEKDSSDSHNVNVLHTDRLTGDVTFNANGHGTAPSGYSKVDKGSKISAPTAPTATGYTFGGWYKESACTNAWNFASDTIQNDSTTLFAKWTPHNYTVTYNNNGGSGTMTSTSGTYDEDVTLRSNTFTKTGYTFQGWATSASGAKVYNNGQTVTDNSLYPGSAGGSKPLYANWSANNYTVAFYGNGATSGSTASVGATYDQNVTLTTNGFIRTNAVFLGWATSEEGAKAYNDGQTVTDNSLYPGSAGGTKNLYAKWLDLSVTKTFVSANKFGIKYTFPKSYSTYYNTIQVRAPKSNLATIEYETKTYTPTESGDNYAVTIPVNSTHLSADITFKLLKGEEVIYLDTQSIKDAAKSIVSTGSFDKNVKSEANMLKAAFTYGAYSQLYFGINTSNLASNDINDKLAVITAMNNTAIAEDTLSISKTGTPSFGVTSAAFSSGEGFVLRFVLNLKGASDCSHFTVTSSIGTASFVRDEIHDRWTVEVSGITSEQIFTQATVVVSDKVGGGSRTIQYGIGTYLYSVETTESLKSDTALYNLCKSVNLLGTVANA